MIKFIGVLGLSGLSAILYRWGGIGKPFNSKCRDFGVPACGIFILLYLWQPSTVLGWLSILLSFGLSFASMTTYHKWLNKYFGKPNTDCFWFNWLATGLCYGLSALPLTLGGIHLSMILLRSIILAFLTMAWSERISEVNLEEGGRGFLYAITIVMLIGG